MFCHNQFKGSGVTWIRPTEVSEALQLLSQPDSRVVVANTSTGIYANTAKVLIDISQLAELRTIEAGDNELKFGSAVSIADFIASLKTNGKFGPVLPHLNRIASHHVRNVGSIAGKLFRLKALFLTHPT